ncbi:hypothetical protein VM1G_11985 [Cytospora mali]|uniref:EamA domain-containing protein n=1 Tax=Cytospora mali TaxID=578113 RepID=A0A194WE42_CYTMA|nr:hypothetical protein VM1G_11985 [Valsa mali]
MDGTGKRTSFVMRHRPSILVLASQISAAVIHSIVKVLETGTQPVHPFQILHVRLMITGVGCTLYLWYRGVPGFPLGPRDARTLLSLRALGGVCGAVGFYFSILYLTLAQATALNFLAPLGAMVLAKYLDFGTFSIIDRVGGVVALIGIVLVVQPDSIFTPAERLPVWVSSGATNETPERLKGVVCGLIGVFGGIIALTTIRRLGCRVHPLMSVNYFAWAVIVAMTIMIAFERTPWPTTVREWSLLVIVGIFGSLMEALLTAGISSDASSAATVMIYSQVLWALALDRVVWHVSVNIWTLVGVGSVVCSLALVSLAKEVTKTRIRGGVQYVGVTPYIDGGTRDVDMESLYASGDINEDEAA